MAYVVEVLVRIGWVGDGMGGAGLGQSQANVGGMSAGLTPGPIFNAQVLQFLQREGVAAVNPDAPTQTEFRTAMTLAATDINSNDITAANVATMQGWASGLP